MLLVRVAGVLTGGIFIANLVLRHPVMDALLFSLAIAVGISPQLLPGVVATSLAAGSRQLARQKVLVKRLVCIEDLGDVSVLFTDKTGTLTDGRISFERAIGTDGAESSGAVLRGLLCTEATVEAGRAVDGNPLDLALWNAQETAGPAAEAAGHQRLAIVPFDHERRRVSVLVQDPSGGRRVVVKGAPEDVLDLCTVVPDVARRALTRELEAGNRVVAVASRPAGEATTLTAADECGLELDGLLVFLDPPKPSARSALDRLARLGVTVKIVTGDHPAVAASVCTERGLPPAPVVTGADLDAADDEQLARPSHWDIRLIRQFMLVFGPISSLFDIATFALMLGVFHAQAPLFRSGWFVESLATQTLVIFAIRTRRVPFLRSRPGRALLLASLGVVGVGALLPFLPIAGVLGLRPLPLDFFLALTGMVVLYLVLIEVAKTVFFRRFGATDRAPERPLIRHDPRSRRIHRRAARFLAPRRVQRG